jgi:hypothetical protein
VDDDVSHREDPPATSDLHQILIRHREQRPHGVIVSWNKADVSCALDHIPLFVCDPSFCEFRLKLAFNKDSYF